MSKKIPFLQMFAALRQGTVAERNRRFDGAEIIAQMRFAGRFDAG